MAGVGNHFYMGAREDYFKVSEDWMKRHVRKFLYLKKKKKVKYSY